MKNTDKSKIIVVKVGSSVLAKPGGGLDDSRIQNIAEDISTLRRRGFGMILVSSGAIASGMELLKLDSRPESLPVIQASAAAGQAELIKRYNEHFKRHGMQAAQVLLTQDDINNRGRYLNAKNTLMALLAFKEVIPVINENDTVSTEEIKFGDNDRLSSLVANLVEADKLVIMSDVDGLYRFDKKDKTKKDVIRRIDNITDEIEELAASESSRFGVGGMATKLQAAKIAVNAGIECAILNGGRKGILVEFLDGKEVVGTVFLSKQPKVSARKRWIAYSLKSSGQIKVDAGAKEVLIKKNRSLLASGITGLSGRFDSGDPVAIVDEHNKEFARGLTNYSSAELNKIMGRNTKDIEAILGYKNYDEVIHRDNMIIL